VGTARPAILGVGQLLAPHADRDVGLLPADRHVGVGRVRDAQELLLEVFLDPGERRVEILDPFASIGGGALQLRDLRAIGAGPALDRRPDLF
jgi:hypothetical protein